MYRYAVAMPGETELSELATITKRYRRAEKALKAVRAEAVAGVIAALKAGARPTDVDEQSPFTPAYNRRKAREAGLEPRRKGDDAAE